MPVHAIFLLSLDNVVFTKCHGFDYHVKNSRPEERHIDTDSFQMLTECRKTPLEAKVIMLGLLVLNEVIVLLINRVISQMHVPIILVEFCSVSLGSETCETFLVNVKSQRFVASNHNINSQVKFVAVDKQWIGDIPRNDTEFINVQVIDVVNDMDASSST